MSESVQGSLAVTPALPEEMGRDKHVPEALYLGNSKFSERPCLKKERLRRKLTLPLTSMHTCAHTCARAHTESFIYLVIYNNLVVVIKCGLCR